MKTITLAYTDFYADFNPDSYFITRVLSAKYDVKIVAPHENPDLLVYSAFGYDFLKYNGLKLYVTGENDVPDFNYCDYAISSCHIDFRGRHLRLPYYVWAPAFDLLRSNQRVQRESYTDRGFCSICVSNSGASDLTRMQFYDRLSHYKPIASGGRWANNVGGPVASKTDFITQYKFNIAFENSAVAGYTTEKLLDALQASTVPIYWGDPEVSHEINKKSYIDISDFPTFDQAIDFIKKVDEDDNLYLAYLNEDPLSYCPFVHYEEALLDFLDGILQTRKKYTVEKGYSGILKAQRVMQAKLYSFPSLRNNVKKIEYLSKVKQHLRKTFTNR
jgi:hypothetical protein